MTWEDCLKMGDAAKNFKDVQRAKSLLKMSERRLSFIEGLKGGGEKAIIFGEMYEALLETCHALACMEGYKISNHACITHFLAEVGLNSASAKFERFRLARNGMNYYGRIPDDSFVVWAIDEIGRLAGRLRTFMQERYGL